MSKIHIIIELPTFHSVICNHFYIADGDSFCSSASPPVSKRQMSVLMDPSVKNYQKLVKSAKQFMRDEIEKVPVKLDTERKLPYRFYLT